MKVNQIKFFAIAIITFSLFAVVVFDSAIIQSVSTAKKDTAAAYKTQCAACHNPKAEKLFDPAKADETLVEIIIKGKKGAKPPFMPAFEAKGMTAGQAKELVVYMRQLRTPSNSNTQNTNTSVNANTNANVNANTNANVNVNVSINSNANANLSVNSNANSTINANVNSNVMLAPDAKAIEAATATYKTKCMVCHTAKAEKFFDIAKTDDQHIEAILKGRKGAKPPFMLGFETKGITAEQAKVLVFYMRKLKVSGK
jgi:mono/diheme cytochrome c family protein